MFDLVPFGRRREEMFGQLAKSFNDLLGDDFFAPLKSHSFSFNTDIHETDRSYLIEADLPGFKKEDITVDYTAPYLTIKAVRNEHTSAQDDTRQTVRQERRYGEYVRRFMVQDIDGQGIRASLKDGVLKLDVPKLANQRSSRIEIEDGE